MIFVACIIIYIYGHAIWSTFSRGYWKRRALRAEANVKSLDAYCQELRQREIKALGQVSISNLKLTKILEIIHQ